MAQRDAKTKRRVVTSLPRGARVSVVDGGEAIVATFADGKQYRVTAEFLLRSCTPESGAASTTDNGSVWQHFIKSARRLMNGSEVHIMLWDGARYVLPWDFILSQFNPEYQQSLKGN
jgi:hypothetical protein